MRILIIGDVHWSEYSSVLRKQGEVYSQRLENLIETINWCESLCSEKDCGRVVYLGDFFDKPTLNDREISALREICWNMDVPHDAIVGNHESSVGGLQFSSTRVLESGSFHVHSCTSIEHGDGYDVLWLPYITEDDRKPLSEYIGGGFSSGAKRIVFSHNDLMGVSFGQFESKVGFTLDEIEANSDLFVNGHLHNGAWVTKKILNLGNITGQNFGEDAYRYEHHAAILDTDTLRMEFIENPHAFNFAQISIANDTDVGNLRIKKGNMVVNFRCPDRLIPSLREKLKSLPLAESRITAVKEQSSAAGGNAAAPIEAIDGNKKFSEFMLDRLGSSELVKKEILEVTR